MRYSIDISLYAGSLLTVVPSSGLWASAIHNKPVAYLQVV